MATKTDKAVAAMKETNSNVPAYLPQGKKRQIGNLDQTDRIVPRIKLIQRTSEEPQTWDAAKVGEFWHTLSEQSLGESVRIVPLIIRKSYVLWAPRNDERGILARANDAIHWDLPNTEFEVNIKGAGKQVYNTGDDVPSSGLADFGSSIKGDSRSRPAASLTYQMLAYLPDYPDISPAIIINTRSSIKPMQALISKTDGKPVDIFYQLYRMSKIDENGEEGPYFNYLYTGEGYVDEDIAEKMKEMVDAFSMGPWRANDEGDDVANSGGGGHAAPKGDSKRTDF